MDTIISLMPMTRRRVNGSPREKKSPTPMAQRARNRRKDLSRFCGVDVSVRSMAASSKYKLSGIVDDSDFSSGVSANFESRWLVSFFVLD